MTELDTRYGTLTVPDSRRDLIGRFLQHYGEWAWDEVSFVAQLLPDKANVLDVGAYLGTFGLGLSQRRQLRSLCLVEASPRKALLLESNVRRNAQVPAIIVEALVTGSGSLSPAFGHADPEKLGSTSYASGALGDLLVQPPLVVLTLSDLREEHGPFDLVKLDAEGMELEILRGDAEFLARGQTTLWAECNEAPASIEVAALLGLRSALLRLSVAQPRQHAWTDARAPSSGIRGRSAGGGAILTRPERHVATTRLYTQSNLDQRRFARSALAHPALGTAGLAGRNG